MKIETIHTWKVYNIIFPKRKKKDAPELISVVSRSRETARGVATKAENLFKIICRYENKEKVYDYERNKMSYITDYLERNGYGLNKESKKPILRGEDYDNLMEYIVRYECEINEQPNTCYMISNTTGAIVNNEINTKKWYDIIFTDENYTPDDVPPTTKVVVLSRDKVKVNDFINEIYNIYYDTKNDWDENEKMPKHRIKFMKWYSEDNAINIDNGMSDAVSFCDHIQAIAKYLCEKDNRFKYSIKYVPNDWHELQTVYKMYHYGGESFNETI